MTCLALPLERALDGAFLQPELPCIILRDVLATEKDLAEGWDGVEAVEHRVGVVKSGGFEFEVGEG